MDKSTILFQSLSRTPWIGGIYYRKNIIYSLLQNEEFLHKYRIVVLTNEKYREVFDEFDEDIRIETCKNNVNMFNALLLMLFYCLKYKVKYIFPLMDYKFLKFLGITPISWIADFQHIYYPDFFEEKEIKSRNRNFSKMANGNNPLVVSSKCAMDDLLKNYNMTRNNVFVVHFVSYIGDELKKLTVESEKKVLENFGLQKDNYICISNQFWQHKNHKVIFQSIKIMALRKDKHIPLFVFTGELTDRRNPAYFDDMKAMMLDELIKPYIKVLGFVSRNEQLTVMKNAVLVIQPSLFEGWGTVLEDAKVLNQRVLLSDIPVHREQMNKSCILFDPIKPEDLCDKLAQCLSEPCGKDTSDGLLRMQQEAAKYSKAFIKILS